MYRLAGKQSNLSLSTIPHVAVHGVLVGQLPFPAAVLDSSAGAWVAAVACRGDWSQVSDIPRLRLLARPLQPIRQQSLRLFLMRRRYAVPLLNYQLMDPGPTEPGVAGRMRRNP